MNKKIAYIILAHNDITNLERLIKKLDYESDFYIHIDSKYEIGNWNTKNLNVRYLEKRLDIKWGGFTMVEATKELIKEALKSKDSYSHIILLSGSDYPLKNKKEIHNFFMKNQGVEFIRAYKINDSNCKKCKNKVKKYWFNDLSILKSKRLNKIIRKIIFYGFYFNNKESTIKLDDKIIEPCFGSQWWALTPMCLEYISDYIDNNPEIDIYFKNSYAPDEMYFHTIVFNSIYCKNTVKRGIEPYSLKWKWENLHYLDSKNLGCELHYMKKNIFKKIFNKVEGSTSFYNEEIIDSVLNSEYLFIRKVKTGYSNKLLNWLDKNIHSNNI